MDKELTEVEVRLQEIISGVIFDPLDEVTKSFLRDSFSNVDWESVLSEVVLDPLGEAIEGLTKDVFPDAQGLEYTITEADYDEKITEVHKILRHDLRRDVLFHLVKENATSRELRAGFDVSRQSFYHQLKKLHYSGFVTRSRDKGPFVYSISPHLKPLIAYFYHIETYIENAKSAIKERLSELNQLVEDKRIDSSAKAPLAL